MMREGFLIHLRSILLNSMMNNRYWVAKYFYIPHSKQSEFLCENVWPLLVRFKLENYFFYLRYWQGGPHIRIRILCGPEAAKESEVVRFFALLESQMPSFNTADRYEYAQSLSAQSELARLEGEKVSDAEPIGTIRDANYEPEFLKYGGSTGVAIAESVFRSTSSIVIGLLERESGHYKSTPLSPVGEALVIMANSLAGAGLTKAESIVFLEEYRAWWIQYTTPDNRKAWPKVFLRISEHVNQICIRAWSPGGNSDPFYSIMSNATDDARNLPENSDVTNVGNLTISTVPYLSCLANYIHTTNNRLGLVPAGEALVAEMLIRELA